MDAATVQITDVSATRLRGTYDLTLCGGDAVVGAFDVALLPSP